MVKILLTTTSLAGALLLAACGGSSDSTTVNNPSGPTVNISSANQQAVATEVGSNALQFTGSVLGAAAITVEVENSTPDSINIRALLSSLWRQAHAQAIPVAAQALAATISSNEPCNVSGTFTMSYEDTNDNKKWNEGETGTLAFDNCVQSGDIKLTGSIKDEFLSETLTTTVDKFSFAGLKASKGTVSSELGSGSMVVTSAKSSVNERYQTTDLKVKVTEGAKSESFTLNEDVTLARNAPDFTQETISGNGSIQSNNVNINGFVTFDITTPIVVSVTDPIQAMAGQITITGSGGTALYISFATPSAQTVTLQVKKDGQNVGNSKEVSVSTILAGLNATL